MEIFKLHADIMGDYKSCIESFVNIQDVDIAATVKNELSSGKPELDYLETYRQKFYQLATDRSPALVSAHERFSKAVGGSRYEVVTPVLSMDVIGVYIILPDASARGAGL